MRSLTAKSLLLGFLLMLACARVERGRVGEPAALLPTGQHIAPAGEHITINARPVDLAISANKQWLYAKTNRGVAVFDLQRWALHQELPFGKDIGGSIHGLAVSHDGARVYATTAQRHLYEFQVNPDGRLDISRIIDLPGPAETDNSHPTGVALTRDGRTAYVCLSRNNVLAIIDLATGERRADIPVGVAPYSVLLTHNETTAYVSNWGQSPYEDQLAAKSSGSLVAIDSRGVASNGSLAVVDLNANRLMALPEVGRHPSEMALGMYEKLYVANANSDTLSVYLIRSGGFDSVITAPWDVALPGSAPSALYHDDENGLLYIANSGNNSIAMHETDKLYFRWGNDPLTLYVTDELLPTAWYPSALESDGQYLYVATTKGFGSRAEPKAPNRREVYAFLGAVSRIPLPIEDAKQLTKQAEKSARIHLLRKPPRALRRNNPIPTRDGDPTPIKHVVYIIKENRTYDQVFGDMPQSNADPSLCIFGREVTPNHHAIADRFVLLDNYYCNGVCSADGHAWATEGNVTGYLERSFGGFTRTYTFGDDPLSYSSAGFVWDHVHEAGLSFRNYGEMAYATLANDAASFNDILRDFQSGAGKLQFTNTIGIGRLNDSSCFDYPGWNMKIPDVLRADVFLRELSQYEAKGEWPRFIIVYLPQDHGSGAKPGMPTPRAHVADNDLALGRIIEGISHSRFWKETAVFVNEDDPQDGFDHVDGHRSICLVAGPYAKRGKVISAFYNQTAVLHTIARILGIRPWTQMVAIAPVMHECFTPSPDFTPYTALPNRIPLDELNPPVEKVSGIRREIAVASLSLDFQRVDAADEDTLNRIIWHSVRGEEPYPAHYAGAHGSGLGPLGLALDISDKADDDD